MSLDTRMVHPQLATTQWINVGLDVTFQTDYILRQLPSWSFWHWSILASCSAHARDVKPLWISWHEKREGLGDLWLCFGNHGQLGNLQMKVTWENIQMGNFSLPCLTTGYIWMKPSFHLLVCSLNRMVLNLHPFLAEVVECQRLTPREFVRQNEQILFRMLALFCRCTVQNCSFFFLQYRAFQSKNCVDVFPRITWFKNVKKTSNHFERSGADEVSLSQHSRHPAGWLDDSLISLGFSWCSLQLKESKSECKRQNYDPKIIKISENARNTHGHSKLAVKRS